MGIIDRYILKQLLPPFLFGASVIVFLFLMQFILKYIDKLLGKGLDEWIIVQFVALNIPWMLVLAIPIGVLFSCLMTFGSMSASHEITVVKASGGSLLRMMAPVLGAGVIMTAFLFWFNDYVLPESNHRASALRNDINRKKPSLAIEPGQFSQGLEGVTILSRSKDSISGMMRSVTIYDQRKSRKTNVVSADSGLIHFAGGGDRLVLTLFTGEIHQIVDLSVKNARKILFDEYEISLDASGHVFKRSGDNVISRGDREMRIKDMQKIVDEAREKKAERLKTLKREIEKHSEYLRGELFEKKTKKPEVYKGLDKSASLEREQKGELKNPPGFLSKRERRIDSIVKARREKIVEKSPYFDRIEALKDVQKRVNFLRSSVLSDVFQKNELERRARQYEVEIHKKYAIPFACIVFLLAGCPLGIITKGGNFGLSSGISLAFYIFYWACLIGGEKLADRGFLSPALSMWMGNIIVGVFAALLVARVNNESFGLSALFRFKRKSKV